MRFGKSQGIESQVTRRTVLQAAAAAGAGVILRRTSRAADGKVDYTARETFDRFDHAWNNGNANADKNNESGALGWGEAYAMLSYVVMYEAHRDTYYLDRLVTHADQVLKHRDSVRGVKDYQGLSGPAWRAAGHYTCGAVRLKDERGRDVLELRTAARPADGLRVAVAKEDRAGAFKLTITRGKVDGPPVVEFDGLTMDRGDANYIVRRVNDTFAETNAGNKGAALVTVKDVRTGEDAGMSIPRLGGDGTPVGFTSIPYVFAVQTGQIVYPMARFAALVNATDDLKTYRSKAEEYLLAVEAAVGVHDGEWREDPETGRGWLVWPKGSPVVFDGCELPHNQYLALGRAMIILSEIGSANRREMYRDRATKMARTFKSDLEETRRGGYRWPYFWSKGWAYRGWKAGDGVSEFQPAMVSPSETGYQAVEDTSHAAIDIDFALLAWKHRLGVFDDRDIRKLAATLTKQIAIPDGYPKMAHSVDGSGKAGDGDNISACWVPLTEVDRGVFDTVRTNFDARQPKPGAPSLPLGIAYLNKAAR